MGTLVERFAEAPPGTPSRPPAMLQNRTLGRGRTVLNWQAAAADGRPAEPPDLSDLHAPSAGGVLPSRPAPLPPQPPPEKKTVRMMAAAMQGEAPSQPPGGSGSAVMPVQVLSGKQTLITGRSPVPAMPPAAASDTVSDAVPDGNRRGSLFVMALVAGLVALIGAVAIVIWFATRPAAPPPQPLPAPLLPVPASPSTPATGTQAGRAAGEEPSGEVARPADAAPVATVPGSAPAAGQALGPAEPFPAHFRENTALFWFDDDQTRDGFLARVSAVKPTSTLRLVGHATEGEAAAGRGSLGLSRAWAVRRWLIRQGIDDGRIETERGRNVPDRGPHDTRGLALNHRVDITVE